MDGADTLRPARGHRFAQRLRRRGAPGAGAGPGAPRAAHALGRRRLCRLAARRPGPVAAADRLAAPAAAAAGAAGQRLSRRCAAPRALRGLLSAAGRTPSPPSHRRRTTWPNCPACCWPSARVLVQMLDKIHWRGWVSTEPASLRLARERTDALLQRSSAAFAGDDPGTIGKSTSRPIIRAGLSRAAVGPWQDSRVLAIPAERADAKT